MEELHFGVVVAVSILDFPSKIFFFLSLLYLLTSEFQILNGKIHADDRKVWVELISDFALGTV